MQYNETVERLFFQDGIEVQHITSLIELQIMVCGIVLLQHMIILVLIYMLIEFTFDMIQEARKLHLIIDIVQYDDMQVPQVQISFTNDIYQLQLLRIKNDQKQNESVITTK